MSRCRWRYYLRRVGPGLVTGASDDDPFGIATYAQAGAGRGYALLWTSLVTFPLMAAVQEMCDRTALTTGRSLGELTARRWRGRTGRVVIGVLRAAGRPRMWKAVGCQFAIALFSRTPKDRPVRDQ
jgi:Mn2+/Fe2+ NRAMP family transporter